MQSISLLPLAPFQETLNAGVCGPAVLKMLLMYWDVPGKEKSDVELARECGTDSILGTSGEQLVAAAETYGFVCTVKTYATFGDIEVFLARRVPVVVDWFSPGIPDAAGTSMPDGHYSLVVGLDESHIYLQDPEIGAVRIVSRDDFMRVWFDFTGAHITKPSEMIVRWMCAVYPKTYTL